MIEFLTYDLKVAALLAVFYMFYRLMLAHETFHRLNRVVLLLTAVASFVLPLCVVTMHETVTMSMPMVDDMTYGVPASVAADNIPQTPWWHTVAILVFAIGMVVTLGHTFWSLFRIVSLIRKSEKHPQEDGTIICVTGNAALAPFSWMCFIVMNRSDYEEQNAAILTHERGHIRLHHSWDLLLVDTLTALQWFNPAIWMLRSDLRAIHEYEADGAVLSQGINARQYQYLLITKAASIGGYSLANGISHSTLKNRINMMLHKKSNPARMWKLLMLAPIVAVALAVNAETVTDVVYVQDESSNAIVTNSQEQIATLVEELKKETVTVTSDEKQKFVAQGIIYDYSEDNPTPIVGAVVVIAGTKVGTVTDKEGKFKLEVSNGDKLTVSYVGYESTTFAVSKAVSEKGNPYKIGLLKESADSKNRPFDVVEEMPQYPGGATKLFEYLAKSVKYPADAEKAGVQGRVIINFVVEKNGAISDARVVKSVYPSLDAEGLRIVNSMPHWIPGKQNGKAVRVKFVVPITFALHGSSSVAKAGDGEKVEGANAISELVVVGYGQNADDASANRPLVVVDGKTVEYASMKSIDPKTIDHMEVLKDKSATDKYGEKGKNGVILITTKK